MAAMSPEITLLRNKLVRKLLDEGKTSTEIAKLLGTSKQGCGAMIKRNGLDKPPAKLRWTAAEKKIVMLARKQGVTVVIDFAVYP